MADPVLIEPTLTLAGQAAAFNADNTGLELKITHASFGRAHYNPTGEEVALVDPVGSKVMLAGGSRPTPYQLRMSLAWKEDVGEVPVGEIGFWSNETLVFIWSKADGTIASYKTDGVTYVLFNDLSFAQVPAGSINIDVDPNESVALAALSAHEGAADAHPQYLLRRDVAKDFGALNWLGLAGGTEDELDLTIEAPESILPAYAPGQRFQFTALMANLGPVTARINGLEYAPVLKSGPDGLLQLEEGDLRPSAMYELTYDGESFQVSGGGISGSSSGSSTAGVSASYSKDSGAANAYIGTYLPAVTSLIDGAELVFLAKTDNTGASTFSPNGVEPKPIVSLRYGALTAGNITSGSICTVRYLASLDAWVLTGTTGSAAPTTLAGYGITDAYTKAQMDALVSGGQSKVVGLPVVTGSSSVTAGTVVSLTVTATSLLNGGSIVSFTWTLPDGTTSTTAASSGSATKSVTAIGSIGTNYAVTVYATDNAGNRSAVATKNIAITSHNAPTIPSIIVQGPVYQGSTGNQIRLTNSTASDGATLTYSITTSNGPALTFSKTSGIADLEMLTFTAPSVAVDTIVTVRATAVDSMGAVSPIREVGLTISAVPSVPGTPFGGGYYVGRMLVAGQNYALIVAPKASGQKYNVRMTSSSGVGATVATSTWDGLSNTNAIAAAGVGDAAQFCKGLTIGGYTDWAVPAKDQIEMLYRYLKPTTDQNSTGYGVNPNSNPPSTTTYTALNPTITAAAAFKTGGSEAFLLPSDYYWGSTMNGGTYSTTVNFQTGSAGSSLSYNSYYVRAVRMIKI